MRRVIAEGGSSQIRRGFKTMIEWEQGRKLCDEGLLSIVTLDAAPMWWTITPAGRKACEEYGLS